jgi:hypothetical protein
MKRKVVEETNAKTWTPSKKQCQMNSEWDYSSHEIDISKELDADFNILNIHLMSHWADHILQYGALPQFSAEKDE